MMIDLESIYHIADAIVQSGTMPESAKTSRENLSTDEREQLGDMAQSAMQLIMRVVQESAPLLRSFTQGEVAVLMAVGSADTAPAPKDLAERVTLTRSRVSQILGQLEDRGYVARVRDARDQRQIRVTLTDEGADAYHLLREKTAALIENYFLLLGRERSLEFIEILKVTADMLDSYDLASSSELLAL